MRQFRSPMVSIRLSENQEANQDVQLFRIGTFHHEEYGKFNIDSKMLQEMKNNFMSRVRGVDIAIDYKHASEDIAAGWIKEVFLTEDGQELWAKVEWTPNGQKVISDKEFRYLSPEFIYDYQDNETLKQFGAVLLGAGLTNRPVIKKMEPVVELSEAKEAESKGTIQSKQGGVKMQELDKMSPEQLIAMIKDLQAKLEGMSAMEKELGEYKNKAAEMEKAKACAERKSIFAQMLSEGKVCKAQEQSFIDGDMTKFIELAQKVSLNEGKGSSAEPPKHEPKDSEDAQDQVLKLADAKKKEKKLSEAQAIREVLAENPNLKQKIYG